MNDEDFASKWAIAKYAARATLRRFPNVMDVEDLQQEAMAWLYAHPERVAHHTYPDGTLYRRGLSLEVQGVLAKVARKETNHALGVDTKDQYAYAESLVEVLLPGVWDPNFRPLSPDEERVSVSTDPSEGNNLNAALTDLRRAVGSATSRDERRALYSHSVLGYSWREAERVTGMGRETLRRSYRDGLRAVVVYLNDRPAVDPDEPDDAADTLRVQEALEGALVAAYVQSPTDDENGAPRGRRVLSNAQARALTDNQYEE